MIPSLARLALQQCATDVILDYVDEARLRADAQARGIRLFPSACPVCLEPFQPDDAVEVLSCGHTHHLECARNYYSRRDARPECMTCSRRLTPAERTEVKYGRGVADEVPRTRHTRQRRPVQRIWRPEIVQAAQNGFLERVQELITSGANVNEADSRGKTALYWASFDGRADVVRVLLAAGANVNYEDRDGRTALYAAILNDHADIVEMLLAAEPPADVNRVNHRGETPLTQASRWGHAAVVAVLLAAGANVNHANDNGETALTLANYHNYDAVAALLRARGAT
jgi:hypothetical protein